MNTRREVEALDEALLYLNEGLFSFNKKKNNKLDNFFDKYPQAIMKFKKLAKNINDKIRKAANKNKKYIKDATISGKSDFYELNGYIGFPLCEIDGKAVFRDCIGTDNYGKICDMVNWKDNDSDPYTDMILDDLEDNEDDLSDSEIASIKNNVKKLEFAENILEDLHKIIREIEKEIIKSININIKFYTELFDDDWLISNALDTSGNKYNVIYLQIPIKDYNKI